MFGVYLEEIVVRVSEEECRDSAFVSVEDFREFPLPAAKARMNRMVGQNVNLKAIWDWVYVL